MTPKPPGLLVRYIQQGRCVVFVGAGLSVGAGLPTWKKLLLEVIQQLVSSMPEGEAHLEELERLVEQGKLLEVADFCKEKLGAAYHQFLTERLRGDTAPLPETHHTLMQLPFSAWVTTNYDKLLERAYSAHKGGFPKTLTHKDTDTLGRLLFDAGPFILKAHGDIDRPETVVLTSRDYSEIIHANPAFNEIFSGLLLTKALFFVGYSLSDPDFRLLMDRQLTHFKGFIPERYALMTDLGPVERDVLWRTARIQVIPYASGKHEQVLSFLQALKAAVSPPPPAVAPQVQTKVVPQNMAATTHVPMAAPAPAGIAKGPVSTGVGTAPEPFQSQSAPGGSSRFLSWLLEPQDDSGSTARASVSDEFGDIPRAGAAPAGEAAAHEASPPPQATPAPRAPVAQPQPAPVASQRLFIETVEGALQLRLARGEAASAVQGIAPVTLNEDLWQSLKRALEQGKQSHAWLYTHVPKLFSKYLPRNVLEALGEPGTSSQTTLELHCAPALARFPWELLPLKDRPVCLARKVVRAPVGVAPQARGRPKVRSSPRVLIIEGQGGPIGLATREFERLQRKYAGDQRVFCKALRGEDATFGRVMAELDEALPDLLHFTGGVGQVDGELYLELPGNMELSMGALRSVLNRGRLPFLVVNAPSSAFAPYAFGVIPQGPRYQRLPAPNSRVAIFEGREAFQELATQAGVGAFVGAFDMPSAEAGSAFMTALHHDLLLGMPIADAVRHARVEALQQIPEDPSALQYVLSGAGELALLGPEQDKA